MLPLPVGSYKLPAPAASCRRLLNCFAQVAPPEKFRGDPAMLVRSPGIKDFADTGATEVRGFAKVGDRVFACAGNSHFEVFDDGTVDQLPGTAITGTGPVRMSANTVAVVTTPGNGEGFSTDGATTVQITDPDFVAGGGGADACYLDGYLVFRRPGTPSFINSGIEDLTFNGLDIGSVNGATGNLVGLIANNRELILAKGTCTESWYNAANEVGTPFARSPDGFRSQGCAAGLSLCQQDNAPLMLANDKTFRRLGAVWDKVSQPGIDSVLQRLTVISDCLALPYTLEGHLFVAFTFPNAGRTLVLDLSTGEWHERESLVGTASVGSWRVQAICEAFGKVLVGDRLSGKIGVLDPDTFEEWGEPQVMQWTYSPVYAAGSAASHRRLEIGITGGQGTATGQGQNPQGTLFIADDGGNVFRAHPTVELGAMGEYETRVVYDNLGESRNRVYRFQLSDPVRMFTLDTQLDVEGARR